MYDQLTQLLARIGDLHRKTGTETRMGTIHKVWTKDGEQKLQVILNEDSGNGAGGASGGGGGGAGGAGGAGGGATKKWVTAYSKPDEHAGPMRREDKWCKGMNVVCSTVDGNYRTATLTPYGTNDKFKRPKYANDYHYTTSYGNSHSRHGPDFHERTLDGGDSGSGSGGGTALAAALGATSGSSGSDSDPTKNAVVVRRHGAKPKKKQDHTEPWDGPDDKSDGSKPQIQHWAGKKGEVPDLADKEVIHTQFGDRTTSQWEDGAQTHQVGTGSSAAVHKIIDQMISSKVGGNSEMRVTSSFISHVSSSVGIKGGTTFVEGGTLHLHGSTFAHPMKLCGDTYSPPASPSQQHESGALSEGLLEGIYDPSVYHSYEGRDPHGHLRMILKDGVEPPEIWMTSSFSSSTPPTEENTNIPNVPHNGFRWHDNTTGIEYSWYNSIWSEGGGDITFPPSPAINDLFTFGGRKWTWNGVGWATTLHARMTSAEGTLATLQTSLTALQAALTALTTRVTALETTIDGGSF